MKLCTPFLLLACIASSASAAPTLTSRERRIVAAVEKGMPASLDLLQRSTDIQSATLNLEGVRKNGELLATELRELGFATRWDAMPPEMKRTGHLIAQKKGTRGKRLLLIGHLDTVLEGARFVRSGGRATGNGVQDMKGGNTIIIAALRALRDAGALDGAQISIIFTGDEEAVGEPVELARRSLLDLARQNDVALAFEATIDNTATVARRGVTTWKLKVTGVTAHSQGIFNQQAGSGAIFECARILNSFHQELAGEKYLTFNPSVIVGGTTVTYDDDAKSGTASGKSNVIPQVVTVEGDLRFISNEQRESVKARMQAIVARHLPKTDATITFLDSYPAMSPTPENYAVLAILDRASRDLGFGEVLALDAGLRGAGDVSFVAPFITSLDGLGIGGGKSHTPDEFADLESLPMLIKRTAILLHRLTR